MLSVRMKILFYISLNFILLFVFTTITTTSAWACGKGNHKNETQIRQSKSNNNCCNKACCNSKNKKKNCCGGDCSCSASTIIMADLPKQFSIESLLLQPVFTENNVFFFKQTFSKSTIQDIWQPPITVLS